MHRVKALRRWAAQGAALQDVRKEAEDRGQVLRQALKRERGGLRRGAALDRRRDALELVDPRVRVEGGGPADGLQLRRDGREADLHPGQAEGSRGGGGLVQTHCSAAPRA